jgi:hypothetical protein
VNRRAAIELGVSAVSLLVAALLVLVLLEVRPWERGLERGDARFNAAPQSVPLSFGSPTAPPLSRWKTPTGFPGRIAERLLGLRDDVAYRHAVALYRAAAPNPNQQVQFSDDPELPARRIRAQQALTSVSKDDPDRRIRSRATNMLGILVRSSQTPQDPNEQRNQILTAIGLFRNAILLDSDNADAKLNLELVLQDPQTQAFVGSAPTGSPDVGNRAGAGQAGKGY